MSHRRLHIVLIGFMGSGKSTIGLILANHLNIPFIDLDKQIEVKEKLKVSEIFSKFGETYFRNVESELLQLILKSEKPSIIAAGGGTPCHKSGIKHINKNSVSFYLKVGRQKLLDRIFNDSNRPLVSGKTKSQVKKFIDQSLRERERFYKKANHVILAYDSTEKIVNRILKKIYRNNL